MPSKLSKQEIAVTRYLVEKKGLRHQDIAKLFKLSSDTIGHRCSRHGIKSHDNWITAKEEKFIIHSMDIGMTYGEIARKLKRNVTSVQRYCIRKDIKYKAKISITKEQLSKVIELIRKNLNARQISRQVPGVSPRMVNYYKAKFDLKGVERGGHRSVPDSELNDIKELAATGLRFKEIASELSQRYGKLVTGEKVRSRIRMYQIPYIGKHVSDWSEQEIAKLKHTYETMGYSTQVVAIYRRLFPNRTSEAIRKKIKKVI